MAEAAPEGVPEKNLPKRSARKARDAGPDPPLNLYHTRDIAEIAKVFRASDPPRESKAEIESRTKIAESQNEHRQRVELIILAMVGAVCLACMVLMFTTRSDTVKTSCLTTLVGIVSAVGGTILGKAIGKG